MILAVIVEYAAGNSVGVQPALPDHRPPAYVNEDFSQAGREKSRQTQGTPGCAFQYEAFGFAR
jgi:hypothetical protein